MKNLKKMMAMMMAMLCMCVVVSSCSSDDDELAPGAAKCIEGVYTSDMTCTVMGQESSFEDVTFTLKSTTDNTMDITISEYGTAPMAIPSLTLDNLSVTGTDGTYAIATKEFSGTTEAGKAYSGTITGSFSNNTLTIDFTLQYGAMPMAMINKFVAVKK